MKPTCLSFPIRPRALRRVAFCLVLALAATTGAEVRAAEVRVTDDLGREVRLARPAQRVICLYGALADMVLALGKGDALVARTRADTAPPEVAALPSIGTHMRPNLELVLGMRPDLVLQMGGRKQAVEAMGALEARGIATAFFNPDSFAGLFSTIERLGALLGAGDQAKELVGSMRERLDAVAKAMGPDAPRPSVVFEVRYPNLLVAGRGSMVTDIIAKAGGMNPVASPRKLVRLSEEELIRLNPDFYVVQKGPMNPAPVPPGNRAHYATLAAVPGRVLHVDERLFSRPGPGSVRAVEILAKALHPDAKEIK